MNLKLKSISVASKCLKAAHSYMCENLSDHKLATLSLSPLEQKLETFLWFLQNKNASSESVAKEALSEFYKCCVTLDEEFYQFEKYWTSVVVLLLDLIKVSRPDIQYLQLGIISEICRKEEYCLLVREEKGFELVSKLLKSINELVNGEGMLFGFQFSKY